MDESYPYAPSMPPAAGLIGQQYAEGPKMAMMPTLKQRMDMAIKQAEERLAAVKRAREILDKNPDLEELLNIMQRVNF